MADVIVGIDLGTTNSEIAIVEDGKPRVLNIDGDPILPSMVGLTEDGKLLVGKPARNQYVYAPDRTIKSIKRVMGDDVKVTLKDQKYRPQEISAMILKKLKEGAEKELGFPVKKAVITVPAYFNDTQRQATREAGELAGLEVLRIINEPTAAALTYNPSPDKRERFLVYDLGGGTFDVSILQAEAGIYEVLSSHGDTKLGGDDFDDLLLHHIASEFQETYQIDLLKDTTTKARLLRAAENAKKALSDHPFVKVEEEFIAEKDGVPVHLSMEIDRADFEKLIAPLIDRTMDCVQKSLNDARLTAAQIERVVLVGGSTRTPMISRLLEERLGQAPHREVHPDLCVALGAAVQGAIVAKQNVSAVLVDITPHTLGIRTLDYPDSFAQRINENHFAPIVRRNTPLPASRSEAFCTVSDRQSRVEIQVFQGESEDVRRNHNVGTFFIEGLAPVPAGNQIIVQLDMTLDGTLKVSAREKATGLVKQITIDNAIARFALEERDAAKERLERLWEDPFVQDAIDDDRDEGDDAFDDEDDIDDPELAGEPPVTSPRFRVPETAGANEAAQAQKLLEKVDRLRDNAPKADQAELDRLRDQLKAALGSLDWPLVNSTNEELSNVLFYLEDA
jgi:molecular chaperone DnaK